MPVTVPTIPSQTTPVYAGTHTPDHQSTYETLGFLAQALAQLTGSPGAYPAGNSGNMSAIAAFLESPLLWAAPTATTGVFQLVDSSYYVLPQSIMAGSPNDSARINAAVTASPSDVRLGPYTYELASTSGSTPSVSLAYNTRLYGSPQNTILSYSGTGIAVQAQTTSNPKSVTRLEGAIDGVIIDITGATGNAVGLYLNDLNGYYLSCGVRGNPALPGCSIPGGGTPINMLSAAGGNLTGVTGVYVVNANWSLNKLMGYCRIEDCGNGLVVDSSASDSSAAIEHVLVDWSIRANNGTNTTSGGLNTGGQNGVMILGGTGNEMQCQGWDFDSDISCTQYANVGLYFNPGAQFVTSRALIRMEPSGAFSYAAGNAQSIYFGSVNSGFTNCVGILYVGNPYTPSNVGTAWKTGGGSGTATVQLGGCVNSVQGGTGDSALQAAVTAPTGWA